MAGVSFGGLASGIDTESIITQLMSIEQISRNRVSNKQIAIQARADGIGDVQGKLNLLRTSASGLGSAATWGNSQTVESSDKTKLAVRTTGTAGPGGYEVNVSKLAAADQHT